jgi:ribonucleoside-diphosphate reductase alpha chain
MNEQDISTRILSDITVYMKYARYLPEEKRRETWEELVTRNMDMHLKKYPDLEKEIRENYQLVYDKKVLPSMRSMQFAGKPIEISPNRVFNCAYAPVDDWRVFGEIMFLLLGGTGVGYSVQHHHVDKLPEIRKPNQERTRRYLINDSIEGWADAVKYLIRSYFFGGSKLRFDYSVFLLRKKMVIDYLLSKSTILFATLPTLFWLVAFDVRLSSLCSPQVTTR